MPGGEERFEGEVDELDKLHTAPRLASSLAAASKGSPSPVHTRPGGITGYRPIPSGLARRARLCSGSRAGPRFCPASISEHKRSHRTNPIFYSNECKALAP